MTKNILFHFLLYKYVPFINSYEDFIENKKKFVFNAEQVRLKDFINKHYVDQFLHKNKFEVIKEFMENPFITKEKKDNLLSYMCVTQRCFNKFRKIYKMYLYKKMKKYNNDTDLCLIPLDNFKNNIEIIQENTIFTFKINDLIRLIVEALTASYDLFIESKLPKNPYNNVVFENHNLYNIYFHIEYKTNISMPLLLKFFFQCDFSIKNLLIHHESYLKDIVIHNFVKNSDDYDKIYDHIINMSEKSSLINIHDDFPKNDVIVKLKHCLLDYLLSEYSYNPSKKRKHKRILLSKLKEFNKEHPRFGRVYRRISSNYRTSLNNRNNRPQNRTINEDEEEDQDDYIIPSAVRRAIEEVQPENNNENSNILPRSDHISRLSSEERINQIIDNINLSNEINDENEDNITEDGITEEIEIIEEQVNEVENISDDDIDQFSFREINNVTNTNIQTESQRISQTWINNYTDNLIQNMINEDTRNLWNESTIIGNNSSIFDNSFNNLLSLSYSNSTTSLTNNDTLLSNRLLHSESLVLNNDIRPSLNSSTIENITSSNSSNSDLLSNIEITTLQNEPYDAYVGPFSSPSNSSVSSSSPTRNENN